MLKDVIGSLPLELKPEFIVAEVNSPILLHDGTAEIQQRDQTSAGRSVVTLRWLPFPRIALEFYASAPSHIEPDEAQLRLTALGAQTNVDLTRVPWSFPQPSTAPIEGVITEIETGSLTSCARIRFHVPNMLPLIGLPVRTEKGGASKKRVVLEYDNWRITLDQIQGINTDELKRTGGSALTHVGTIQRADEELFAIDDCRELLVCFGYFLSFCRGAWTMSILLSAEDTTEAVVGRRWHTVEFDRFRSALSWVPSTEPVHQHLNQSFTGYASAWFSSQWAAAIRIGTQWYVEGSTGAAEKSIILLQSALELFAWTQLVEVTNRLTTDEWRSKQYPFSKKLRLLLTESGIPVTVPADLTALQAYCSTAGAKDGPEAVTSVRNALVHPSPAKRQRLEAHPGVLIDAWYLASWYLDLCILRTCGYTGRYSDRTARRGWKGNEVTSVPWA